MGLNTQIAKKAELISIISINKYSECAYLLYLIMGNILPYSDEFTQADCLKEKLLIGLLTCCAARINAIAKYCYLIAKSLQCIEVDNSGFYRFDDYP